MSKLSGILVPTDFSLACERALAHAAAIAARTGAKLHVLHVHVLHRDMYGWADIPNIEAVENIIADHSSRDLDKFVEKIKPPVHHEVIREPRAADAIVRYARAHDIDLIVMGTHARKGIARAFMGSVAAEVLRESPVSVLALGPEHVLPADLYRRILAPVDFSDSSRAALQQASAIASQHDADLLALHVIEPRIRTPYDGAGGAPEELRQLAARSLDEWLEAARLPKPPVEKCIMHGPPDEQIVSCARDKFSDLIVMGTVGLSGLSRLLLGSTTERTLRNAPCAVLAHRGEIHEDL
ncbi:MAG: universal stress protein [Rhodanobacteraceae bacterium]